MKASVKILRTCVLFAFVALLAKGVSAQTPPTYSVSVTEPYELIEEISTIRRIDREEIEARNARTLDEALRLVPGIYVRTGGDGTPRIDVRGFRSRHVLLLMNGVQINSTSDGQCVVICRVSEPKPRDTSVRRSTSGTGDQFRLEPGVAIDTTTLMIRERKNFTRMLD